jgi:hypothetical protein
LGKSLQVLGDRPYELKELKIEGEEKGGLMIFW